ncbi:unnamed protein product [Auanema sp. JU1783]|nr:unnamed protein product [Auanema sp. JU1783]
MAAVANATNPIQFGSAPGSSNSGVTLTFSTQPGTSGGSTNFFRKPAPFRPFQPTSYPQDILMGDGPGRRLRKNVANVRRHVDYVSNILNHAESRLWQYGKRQRVIQQPDELYQNTALPAWCTPDVPVDCVLTKFVRAAMNKVKCPVYTLCWTPEGKRLITGASTGEFTLWNGTAFNFETILQAHDSAIRAMTWSYNEQWLVSADHDGYIKYWQPNMNNVHMFQAHKDDPIRGLSFAPTDVKFVSASDDGTARIWDFARCVEERVLRGHGAEVRCVDWHPTKGLVVTGSRDSQQPVKLWDPKSGQCLSTIQDHKSSVMAVEWNMNGNWLLTGGRDHIVKLYDIRIMKEMNSYRGHKKEVTSLAWNPVHENLFVSGGGDGSLAYWLVGTEKEVGLLEHAHDQAVWAMRFHPKGHILSTGSNDNNTKFWARNRPGDTQEDIFGLASFTTNMVGSLDKEREPKQPVIRHDPEETTVTVIPGMGLDDDVYENMNREVNTASAAPTAMLLMPEDLNARQLAATQKAHRVLIKQPPPKKAQRQFERMWNVSKPGGVDEQPIEDDVFRRPKASLLGAPPPSMLTHPTGAPPPQPNFPSQRPPLGPPPGWKPNNGPAPPAALRPPPQNFPPPPQAGRGPPTQPPTQPPPGRGPPPPQSSRTPNFPPFPNMPPPGVWSSGVPPSSNDEPDPRDMDYRGSQSNNSQYGNDIDLRSQPPPNRMGPPPSETWRRQENSNQLPPQPLINDPRMRKPEEIRDPRRRHQDAPRQQQQQESRNSWMPQLNNSYQNSGRNRPRKF